MKKSDAVPGTKVLASIRNDEFGDDGEQLVPFIFNEYGDSVLVGVIRSKKASPGKVWVKWIDGDHDEDEEEDEEVEEVDLKILSLESDRAQLEKEFKLVSKQVKEKMKEAAKLVNEAGKLARQANAGDLESMYDASYPLINAMDRNGWRSSSWGC
jgi:hypothetical protein